jgi:hypothetical protein
MRRAWIATAVLAAGLWAVLSPLGADYGNVGCHLNAPRCDEPAWPLEALARGDVARFVHDQPLMGPVSLVLRAPFAAAARVFHADLTWHYRAGLLPCLLISALLALALARRSRAHGHHPLFTATVAVLAFVNPLSLSAVNAGHPEELVVAAGVVVAALLALDGRSTLAALVIGLAIATKAWALLALAPILVAVAPEARRRFVVAAVLVVAVAYAPLVAGDPGRFRSVVQAAGTLGSHYGETAAPDAWFVGARTGDFVWPVEVPGGEVAYQDAPGYAVSAGDARLAHGLALGLALILTFAWWRSGGARRPESLLLLLGAILLLRCVLDPGDHSYYHAAAALALLAYEATRPRARVPWAAGGFIVAVWSLTLLSDHLRTDQAFNVIYLAWAVPTLVGLALIACRRSRSTRLTPRSPISPRRAMASSPG